LDGVAEVFKKQICDKIRRVTVNGELKAAVTTAFPAWAGGVDCLMSLEVDHLSVEWLAMALFNVNVKMINQVWHFMMSGGLSVISRSEITLKGAPGEAIANVFGHEIEAAIIECPIRRRELESEMNATECVSMILIEEGAIINLALSLYGGSRIRAKLYN
jgi:hypothetical protein